MGVIWTSKNREVAPPFGATLSNNFKRPIFRAFLPRTELTTEYVGHGLVPSWTGPNTQFRRTNAGAAMFGANQAGNSNTGLNLPRGLCDLSGATEYSVVAVCRFKPYTTGGDNGIFRTDENGNDASAQIGFSFVIDSATQITWRSLCATTGGTAGWSASTFVTDAAPPSGVVLTMMTRWTANAPVESLWSLPGRRRRDWVYASYSPGNWVSATTGSPTADMNPHIGGMAHPSGCAFPGEIFAVVVFQHALTNEEADRVAAAPFSALFNRQRRPVMYSLPASSTPAVVWNARTRSRQPRGVVEQARNLSVVYLGGTHNRWRTYFGFMPTIPSGWAITADKYGVVNACDGASTMAIASTGLNPRTKSFVVLFKTGTAAAGYDVVMSLDNASGVDSTARIQYDATGVSLVYTVRDSGGSWQAPTLIASPTLNTWYCVALSDNQASGVQVSINGSTVQSITGCAQLSITPVGLYVGGYGGAGANWKGRVALIGWWNELLSDKLLRSYSANPWQLFAPERRPKFFSVGSGANIYAATISEMATASETAAAVATFLSNISETVAASETMIARAVFGSTVAETVTASDSISSIVAFTSTISETATASETVAAALGAATFAASISETVTASETASALVSLQSAISETATASDSISSLVAFISAVSETATASDTIAAALANQTYAASISETASASDVIVATIPTIYAASIIETISISDIAAMGVPSSDFWTQIGTTQLAGWGQINNTQSSGWTIIPTT